MIVQDLRPIWIVECNGFRDLMKYLEPGFFFHAESSLLLMLTLSMQRAKNAWKKS